jgi:hypothetical protein
MTLPAVPYSRYESRAVRSTRVLRAQLSVRSAQREATRSPHATHWQATLATRMSRLKPVSQSA